MLSTLNGSRFIDLFAGIGGFHQAMSHFGGQCVFACEWDKHASATYQANFGITPFGDITTLDTQDIAPHDVLCAGFPCQAFSISGKQLGFDDTRGTLFFEIARIVKQHQPSVLFLENVKNFAKHDKGRTLKVVLSVLDELGYDVYHQILNASDFELPQNRERLYLIGFRKSLNIKNFVFPKKSDKKVALRDFLVHDNQGKIINRDDIVFKKDHTPTFDLLGEEILPNKPIQIGIVGKGGQGERIYHPSGHAITLSAYGGGVGSKTGLYLIDGQVRKLSPKECANIQGFSQDFKIISSTAQAYKQFGNSVAINVLKAILSQVEMALQGKA